MKFNLKNRPTKQYLETDFEKLAMNWFEGFEKKTIPQVFDKIYERIEWILLHKDVANKKWILEQLSSLSTFIELREKDILGEKVAN